MCNAQYQGAGSSARQLATSDRHPPLLIYPMHQLHGLVWKGVSLEPTRAQGPPVANESPPKAGGWAPWPWYEHLADSLAPYPT